MRKTVIALVATLLMVISFSFAEAKCMGGICPQVSWSEYATPDGKRILIMKAVDIGTIEKWELYVDGVITKVGGIENSAFSIYFEPGKYAKEAKICLFVKAGWNPDEFSYAILPVIGFVPSLKDITMTKKRPGQRLLRFEVRSVYGKEISGSNISIEVGEWKAKAQVFCDWDCFAEVNISVARLNRILQLQPKGGTQTLIEIEGLGDYSLPVPYYQP